MKKQLALILLTALILPSTLASFTSCSSEPAGGEVNDTTNDTNAETTAAVTEDPLARE